MNLASKAALLAAVIITATLAVPAIGQPERGIEVGQKIEPRELRTIEREKLAVPAPEGLTVLLFWSTWSPRSARAIQIWQEYGEKYKDHGVSVISMNADNQRMEAEDVQKVRDYIARNEVTLPVVLDTGLDLFNEIGVIVLPTTLFFKPDGTLDYKYASLPSSAELDLKEDLEAKLGIAQAPSGGGEAGRGKLDYQPKNNALLFYGMGQRYEEKGYVDKAKAKYIEALEKDPDYADPLRALEGIFFADGRTTENEERLKSLLVSTGLEGVVERIRDKDEASPKAQDGGQAGAAAATLDAGHEAASAASPEKKQLTPMERMRLLMEGKGN